jgi:hypothetical protein
VFLAKAVAAAADTIGLLDYTGSASTDFLHRLNTTRWYFEDGLNGTKSVYAAIANDVDFTLAFSTSGATWQFYKNGAPSTAVAYGSALRTDKIGFGYSYGWDGPICELRLSSVARSAEWVEAENLAITDALLTYGAEDLPDPAAPVVPVPPIETAEALLCVAVAMAAVKQRHIILYVAAFVLLLFTGFAIAETAVTLSIMPFCFAAYMLYMTALSVGRR